MRSIGILLTDLISKSRSKNCGVSIGHESSEF